MASPPEADDGQQSTGRHPSRLRVMKPEVEEVLRSPRRARPNKLGAAEAMAASAAEDGQHPSYNCVFQEERDGVFAPPELVWGKVRSHPWWPGQVFDPADASELALKHRRRNAMLVAYFSDKTFAWNDASGLRPFRGDFARLARQSKATGFRSAVDAALGEVARRVEAGLSCSCFGDETVKKQGFENAGVREGACGLVVDGGFMRNAFRPESFLEYVSELGQEPLAGADPLELVVAKAQLRAFNRSRGRRDLPEFTWFAGMEGVAVEPPPAKRKRSEKDDGGGVSAVGAVDAVSPKEKKLRQRESSGRKRENVQEDGNGLEDGGHDAATVKDEDDASGKEKKPRHRAGSTRKKHIAEDEERLENGEDTAINKDADVVLSRGKKSRRGERSAHSKENSRRREGLVRKEEAISEDAKDDGGGAADSYSGGEKQSGRRESSASRKVDISEEGRKKKKLSELMVEKESPTSAAGGKSKARGKSSSREDPALDSKDSAKNRKKKKLDTLGDLGSVSPSPYRQKFSKVGELMRRAAGQMSQSPVVLKNNCTVAQESSRKTKRRRGSVAHEIPTAVKTERGKKDTLRDYSFSCGEMLSQFRLAARNPKKGYSFVPTIVDFFTGFKESHASSSLDDEQIPEKVKSANIESTSSELALGDHMQEPYLSDVVVNEDPEDEPLSNLQKKKGKAKRRREKAAKQVNKAANSAPNLPSGSAGSVDDGEELKTEIKRGSDNNREESKAGIKPCSGNGGQLKAETKPVEEVEESFLTSLLLNFSSPSAVPSASDLIEIFSQYGPVKEAKTEIATTANRAEVVFKRRADAEAAFARAGKISALGPALISFRLSYLPSASAASSDPLQGTQWNDKDSPPVQAVH